MTTIGIFGPPDDREVQALADRLRHRGVEPWVVDLAGVPERVAVSLGAGEALVDGRSAREMDAAYLRRGLPEHAPLEWSAAYASTMAALRGQRASQALRTSLVEQVARERVVINPPRVQSLHRLKPWLLWALGAGGVRVPALAAGTDGARLGDFAEAGGARWGGVVVKPLSGIYKTHLWTAKRGAGHRWGRRPQLVQRYVEGETVRCYVLGGQLLSAARIVHGGTVDSSLSQTGIDVLELTGDARRLAESVARELGLAFCGLDLQVDGETGVAYVIDCNLSPMFVSYGQLSRCDIAGALADHLIGCARARPKRPAVLDMVDEAKAVLAQDPEIARLLGRRGEDEP